MKNFQASDFWKKYDAGEFGTDATPSRIKPTSRGHTTRPSRNGRRKSPSCLPRSRWKPLAKKLQELNPGFDGKVTDWDGNGAPKIENGVVTELSFLADNVTDISPVREQACVDCAVYGAAVRLDKERKAGRPVTTRRDAVGPHSDFCPAPTYPTLLLIKSLPTLRELVFRRHAGIRPDTAPGHGIDDAGLSGHRSRGPVAAQRNGFDEAGAFPGAKVLRSVAPPRACHSVFSNATETAVSDLTPLDGMALNRD